MRDQLSDIFREVADLAQAERERYFEQNRVPCDLREEVESLLRYDSTEDPITEVIADVAEAVLQSGGIGEGLRCGPYRLSRLLGRGGAGEVFLAERVDGQVEQHVAIKLLHTGALRRSFRQRFRQERQILASLQHAGIARLLDAGETDEGKPYLVMDYVDGVPIDVYAAELTLPQKLHLFLKVCDAVAYAHRKLIVHRDIKPSNILVDGTGEPKLLDFGIAKILDATTDQTRTIERLLTPDYASPEQVRGAAQSTATDVYSLGAVLYRLLTGKSPHVFPTTTPEAIDEAICQIEPVPASRLNPELPKDVEFILQKALRKEPESRYSSVEALAEDLHAFLEWRPIRARSRNTWYRTRKFLRRYRTPVTAAALTIAALSVCLYLANRQRLIAQERFQQLHLLSAKVFDLDRKIRQLQGATEARHELVSMSVEYLERLGASAHGDLDLAQEIGAAYLRVARIQGVPLEPNLGDFAKAEESLKKADQFIDAVLASRRTSAPALLLSAGIAESRMILADSQQHYPEEKSANEKAVSRLDQLFRQGNPTAAQRTDAALIYLNIALSSMNRHRLEQAIQYAEKSMEASRGLPIAARVRSAALSLIGSSYRAEGRLDEALDSIRESRRIAQGPVYASPSQRAFEVYAILLREARTLSREDGVSLGRTDEAIAVYREAVDLMEQQASGDSRDQNARDRLATCSRELADLLAARDPAESLAMFDLGIRRLREVKNVRARRREATALAESSDPLRRLNRFPEARQRINTALALLRETKDYPAEKIDLESDVAAVLRAQADYESQTGNPRHAVAIMEELLHATMAANPDPLHDLTDAAKISALHSQMAAIYRRVGEARKADEMEGKRSNLWREWDARIPHNQFVQRQLAADAKIPR